VSRWAIRLPFRSEADPVSSIGDCARAAGLDAAERGITRELVMQFASDGAKTVRDALDRLDRATPAERRELLDRARARAGLEPTHEVDAHESYAATQRRLVLRGDIDVPLRVSPSGAIVEDDANEAARARQEAEVRRVRHEQRLAARKFEAEELRAAEEARRDRERREVFAGLVPSIPEEETT
jgi:hypothetical protein